MKNLSENSWQNDCNLNGIITTILSLQNGDYFNMSDWVYMASVSVYRSYA